MVGSSLCRQLSGDESVELVLRDRHELNLKDQQAVKDFFADQAIDEVYLAAAKVGGIHANNTYPADFIMDNMAIQLNVIGQAFAAGVSRLLFLGGYLSEAHRATYPRRAATYR